MPLHDRILWLIRQSSSRHIHISIGSALDPTKLKVKVTACPRAPGSTTPAPAVVDSVSAVLSAIGVLSNTMVATDRGHRHSDGTSVVAIWLSPAPSGLPSGDVPGDDAALPLLRWLPLRLELLHAEALPVGATFLTVATQRIWLDRRWVGRLVL